MSNEWDVIVVGAGAAGLIAAIFAARQENGGRKARVLVLDGQTKIGAKILVAGGGRCNVTNEIVDATRFHSESDDAAQSRKSFVRRVLHSFNVRATHDFFNYCGVELKLEPSGKYFPVSNSARTVLNALLAEVEASGAVLKIGCRVNAVSPHPASPGGGGVMLLEPKIAGESVTPPPPGEAGWGFRLRTNDGEFTTRAVIICTGGLALPKSGSAGAGYEFARQFGHTIVYTTPALTPLLAHPPRHSDLSGVTLPVRLTLRDGNAVLARYDGSFLFTHVGYSGPAALNISRHFARERAFHPNIALHLSLLPDVEDEARRAFWHEWVKRDAKKSLLNALRGVLPERVAQMVLREAKPRAEIAVGKLSPDEAKRVQIALFDLRLPIADVAPYYKAEATAGGVALGEIEASTMMSRKTPGLFFAGEVCDVDGWLGGYNFQWAWSSGAIAGRSAARLALRNND